MLGNGKPRNQALFQKFLKYINVIYDKDLINKFKSLEEVLTLPLGLCLPLHNSCPYLDIASNITQNENQLLEKPLNLFSLNEEDESKGKKILENIGVTKDSWFVTLHVREPGFRGESLKNTDFWRNSNINNYINTIKYITNSGGWVFRMGDKSMSKLPEMKNVIDYAHHEIKSEFMDVYLGAKCKFCIGSPSGYYHIPMIFSKPILFPNSPQFIEYFGLRNNDMYLPKKLYYSDSKKIISISEFSNSPISILTSNNNFNNSNIFVQENSSDEIKEATIEMLKSLNSKNEDLTKKQIVFKDKVIKNSSLYGKNIVPKAKISSYFIEKNTDFI